MVVRIAAKADEETHKSKELIRRMTRVLKSTDTGFNHWQRKLSSRLRSQERIFEAVRRASLPIVPSVQLTVHELLALLAWPIGDSQAPGLP